MRQKFSNWFKKNRIAVVVAFCLSLILFFIVFGNAEVEKPNLSCHDAERNYKCR